MRKSEKQACYLQRDYHGSYRYAFPGRHVADHPIGMQAVGYLYWDGTRFSWMDRCRQNSSFGNIGKDTRHLPAISG